MVAKEKRRNQLCQHCSRLMGALAVSIMNKSSDSFSCMLAASAISHMGLGIIFYGILLYGQPDIDGIFSYIGVILMFSIFSLFVGFFISVLYGIPAYNFFKKHWFFKLCYNSFVRRFTRFYTYNF